MRRRFQLTPAFLDLRERHGRNAEQVPLHRRTHRARVDCVVTHVCTVVDAGDNQIGPVAQQAGQRNVHAIGRRAIDIAKPIGGLVHIQRCIQRQCVGFGAVVVLRGHHFHISYRLQRIMQRHNAGRLISIIVTKQYLHVIEPVTPHCRGEGAHPTRCGSNTTAILVQQRQTESMANASIVVSGKRYPRHPTRLQH
ncbi:hypothetical protein D3C72_1609570 [compost metagenome]